MSPEVELLSRIAAGARLEPQEKTGIHAFHLRRSGYIAYDGSRAVITPDGEKRLARFARLSAAQKWRADRTTPTGDPLSYGNRRLYLRAVADGQAFADEKAREFLYLRAEGYIRQSGQRWALTELGRRYMALNPTA